MSFPSTCRNLQLIGVRISLVLRSFLKPQNAMISLKVLFRLATLPVRLIVLALQYFTVGTSFTNSDISRSLKKTLNCGVFQHMGSAFTIEDLSQLANFKVNDVFARYAAKYADIPGFGAPYTEKNLDTDLYHCDSTWLSYIEERDHTDPILVYIHGGCFAYQLQDNTIEAFANLYRVLEQRNKRVSILFVDYSLTQNGSTYPTQYNEVNYIYDKLIAEGNTNVSLIGDSAGGNLALNVLQHLHNKKDPATVWPKTVIPISPYLNASLNEFRGSLKDNNSRDTFTYEAIKYFGEEYIGHDKVLNESPVVNIEANVHKVDWRSIPTIKQGKVLVIVGENEVLKDQILRWSEAVGLVERHPENVAIDINGVHIGFFVSETVDYNNDLNVWKELFAAKTILSFLERNI